MTELLELRNEKEYRKEEKQISGKCISTTHVTNTFTYLSPPMCPSLKKKKRVEQPGS